MRSLVRLPNSRTKGAFPYYRMWWPIEISPWQTPVGLQRVRINGVYRIRRIWLIWIRLVRVDRIDWILSRHRHRHLPHRLNGDRREIDDPRNLFLRSSGICVVG